MYGLHSQRCSVETGHQAGHPLRTLLGQVAMQASHKCFKPPTPPACLPVKPYLCPRVQRVVSDPPTVCQWRQRPRWLHTSRAATKPTLKTKSPRYAQRAEGRRGTRKGNRLNCHLG
ncbi:Hypothetical predicted protein [Pelobates cultripes]|uniref:Uncharacterized protein n=1 Tax=Pelobates cultripes TaxID=61616 RepID=A0AAD1S7B0_PELCU|nr:Hypothetical predicted protein [Pelobates cultripes]